jgi:hypothetical protein
VEQRRLAGSRIGFGVQVAAASATKQEGVSPLLALWRVLANFEKRGLD